VTTDAPADPRLRLRIVAAYAVIYVVWGSTFLAIRIGVRELPPLLFGGARFLLAGALLTAVALWMRDGSRTAHGGATCCSSFLMITFATASAIALVRIPSNEGALLGAGSASGSWLRALGTQGLTHRRS
jgi:drug/metabolite transporter (DMT)-like permease